MRDKLTGLDTALDPDSRINRALAVWDCDKPALLQRKHVSKVPKVKRNPSRSSSAAKWHVEKAAEQYGLDLIKPSRKVPGVLIIDQRGKTVVDAPDWTTAARQLSDWINARRDNPVPASSRVRAKSALTSRERAEFDRAAKLYADFTGHDAAPLARVKVPNHPAVALCIGFCDGILYSTVRDGVKEKYIHKFRASDRPVFAVSPDGKQLLLIGGAYTFTERGIVDDSDTKNR